MERISRSPVIQRLSLGPLRESDIEPIVSYWHFSEEDHESRGVNTKALGSAEETRQGLFAHVAKSVEDGRSQYFVVRVGDQNIAHFLLQPETTQSAARVHVHVTAPSFRGLGIIPYVYEEALRYFAEKFSLHTFIFETNIENQRINRLLDKLGFPVIQRFTRPAEGIFHERTVLRREVNAEKYRGKSARSSLQMKMQKTRDLHRR